MAPASADSSLVHSHAPASVAVFRARHPGEMLCAVPALRALREALPAAHIALVGLPCAKEFVRRFRHYADEFIGFPGHPDFPEQPVRRQLLPAFYAHMRERQFDLALQMHDSGPQSNLIARAFGARCVAGYGTAQKIYNARFFPQPLHGAEPRRLLDLLSLLGVPSAHDALEFPVTADDERELAGAPFAGELAGASYICIHPGARSRDKCWHPARFAQVADQLVSAAGVRIVLMGTPDDAALTAAVTSYMRAPVIAAVSALSLGALAAMLRRARLLVSNDTCVSHIAAGLRLPSVIVFTHTDAERWSPTNRALHRCVHDPQGDRVQEVVRHARELLLAHRS